MAVKTTNHLFKCVVYDRVSELSHVRTAIRQHYIWRSLPMVEDGYTFRVYILHINHHIQLMN